MGVLNEWIRLTMGLDGILETTFGSGLDLTKLPKEVREKLEVFCFGIDYLDEKDLEYIDAQWDDLTDLHYLHRLYETIYSSSENKVKPVLGLWQEIRGPIYIGINKGRKIYLTYLMLPLNKAKDSIFLETLNRNFKSIVQEIQDIPVVMGIRQSTAPIKPTLYVIDESMISEMQLLSRDVGMYIGDCLIFTNELLLIIGNKITYWDKLNKTVVMQKSDVRALTELLCMNSISKLNTTKYGVFVNNL